MPQFKSFFIALLFLVLCGSVVAGKQDDKNSALVSVNTNKIIGSVNRDVLGNNIIGYRSGKYAKLFNSYGGGVWNPLARKYNKEYLSFMRAAGISVLRWPGGKWRQDMSWKTRMVGAKRQPFGLPEFLELCEELGAKPIITLSAEHVDDIDISALIAYLVGVKEKVTDKNLLRWVVQREKDGRKHPWPIEWLEFGNENYNSSLPLEKYIVAFRKALAQVRKVSGTLKLGVVLEDSDNVDSGWTYGVLERLGKSLDFGIIHPYIPMIVDGAIEHLGMERLIRASLYADANLQYRLDRYQEMAKRLGRQSPLPLAVTEYNAHFKQKEPLPVRHTLSTALHNADFVRVMLHPKSNVIIANYWHLANGYWGMMRGYPQKGEKIERLANYYVFQLYNDYLLADFVKMSIDTDKELIAGTVGIGPRSSDAIKLLGAGGSLKVTNQWLTRSFKGGRQRVNNKDVLQVHFNGDDVVDYHHAYKVVAVDPDVLYRISVRVRSSNIENGKIGIAVEDERGWKKTFYQAKNVNITGTLPWQWVTVDYRTTTSTRKIRIIARKYRGSTATKGDVEFGDVKIEHIEGRLSNADMVTGLATTTKDKRGLSVILINKNIKRSVQTSLDIPQGYFLKRGQILGGESPLSIRVMKDGNKGVWVRDISSMDIVRFGKNDTIELPKHSMTTLMFSK